MWWNWRTIRKAVNDHARRICGWAFFGCVLVLACDVARAAPSRPNVILILTDDQGSVDAACYGAVDLETPGIDGLAEQGVRFSQFYAPAPVCSPSRAGLLTGRYPVRAGVPNNVSSSHGKPGMPAAVETMAEMFDQRGYATAHIGKWHLGYSPDTMPNGQGFDFSFGHMGGCIDNYSHFFYWAGPNRHDLWCNGVEHFEDGRFFPDLMLREAESFLEQHINTPFFIYFAMNSPHYPYQGDVKWLQHYRDLTYPRNLYAAFVSTLDERIGALVRKVDDLGIRDRTIIVFQSDHGHSHELRAHGGGGSAGPFRGAKFSLFEGGIRVPAIISWPAELPSGEVRHQVAHGCDWMATLAGLCNIEPPKRIDGRSLIEVIRSPSAPSPHRELHWSHHDSWAVREGPWKLIANPKDTSHKAPLTDDDAMFLANLQQDQSELTNRASDHPEVVERLERLHEAFLSKLK